MSKHYSEVTAKAVFIVRLSHIVNKINKQITQLSIAKFCGVSPTAISNIQHARTKLVSLDMAIKVADKLGVEFIITRQRKRGFDEKVHTVVTLQPHATYKVDIDYIVGKIRPNVINDKMLGAASRHYLN